jgi:hypothetical protein
MKIEINVLKEHLFLFTIVISLLLGVTYVIAWGSGDPTVQGHDPNEVQVNTFGVDKTLQQAINDGDFADNLGNHLATQNLNLNNNRITNVANPSGNSDAASKQYVDNSIPSSQTLQCTTVHVSGGATYTQPLKANCPAGYLVTGGGCAAEHSGWGTGWHTMTISGNGFECRPAFVSPPIATGTNARCCRLV